MLLLPPRRTWLKGARERMRVQAGRIFFQNQRRWWTGNERRMRISQFYSERGDTRHLRSGDPFTTFEGGVLNASRYKTSALDHTRLSRGILNYEPGFSERKKFFVIIWHSGRRTSQKNHTDTAQPNFLPRHSVTEYIVWQMLLHTAWYIYCPWVSATITHLLCAVSDLLPLIPDLSSHSLQIPGISSIFRSSYGVFCM